MPISWLAALLLAVQAAPLPEPIRLFDADFEQWIVEQPANEENFAAPAVHNDAVPIAANSGWFRTKKPYADFRVSLDFRLDRNARGGLYFRSWSGLDSSGRPKHGDEVPL
jgi:hypothetical protein